MPRGPEGGVGSHPGDRRHAHRLDDGECLLWDDTYPHEVWNKTDEVRIALLLDVWRPRYAI